MSQLQAIYGVNPDRLPGLRISLIQIAPRKPIYKAVSSKMTNCGAIGRDPSRDPSETPPGPLQGGPKYRFFKNPGNGFPWCGICSHAPGDYFKLSRGPQRPYIEKSKKIENLKNPKNPEIRPPYSPGLGPSYLARYAAPFEHAVCMELNKNIPGALT